MEEAKLLARSRPGSLMHPSTEVGVHPMDQMHMLDQSLRSDGKEKLERLMEMGNLNKREGMIKPWHTAVTMGVGRCDLIFIQTRDSAEFVDGSKVKKELVMIS
jgi:hypothetical protein